MRSKIVLISFIVSLSTTSAPFLTFAETPLIDPNIPHGETITYTSRTGDTLTTIVEDVVIKRDGDREIYKITSRSESLDRTVVLIKETMALLSVHTVRKYQGATLDSQLTVLDEEVQFKQDEVKLADFSVLMYVFRGFPFNKLKKLKIGRYGDKKSGKFAFNAKYKKIEKVKANQRTVECYKLELSMDGFWGTFFPKTNMWYSVVPPHYLVRYEGPSGPPGSPKREVELTSYDVIK
jgi:hypothetical protein